MSDLAASITIQLQEAATIARQLAAKRWADFTATSEGGGFLTITMNGIEEAERMGTPILRRWPSEHPVLFGFLMSLIASALTLSIGKLLDIFLKHHGWL